MDGAEAILKYIEFKPSLVLLDISLPIKDGFEACIEMRAHSLEREPRIVAVTALSSQQDKSRGLGEFIGDKPQRNTSLLIAILSVVFSPLPLSLSHTHPHTELGIDAVSYTHLTLPTN